MLWPTLLHLPAAHYYSTPHPPQPRQVTSRLLAVANQGYKDLSASAVTKGTNVSQDLKLG